MGFVAPLVLAGARRARDSGAAASDSAREEAGRGVSVADVPAADSVPVGAPAPHPALGAAADATAALALIVAAFARPFFRQADPCRRDAERRARGGRRGRYPWNSTISGEDILSAWEATRAS